MEQAVIKLLTVNHPDYKQVYDLREEILRKPIGLSLEDEDLSGDVLDTILVAYVNNKIVGCVMLQPTTNATTIKLRQMAVAADSQGKGIGKLLVTASEEFLRKKGVHTIVLHARIVAEGFYERLGYTKTGDVFIEVGIPHIRMGKQLN